MKTKSSDHKETNSLTAFVFSIIVFIFFATGKSIDIYSNKLMGGLFELLWMPMLLIFVVITVISISNLFRSGGTLTKLTAGTFIFIAATILIVMSK